VAADTRVFRVPPLLLLKSIIFFLSSTLFTIAIAISLDFLFSVAFHSEKWLIIFNSFLSSASKASILEYQRYAFDAIDIVPLAACERGKFGDLMLPAGATLD